MIWKRGEMSAQYANWMRLGVFTMVPLIGWLSFGVPIAQASISTAFAFMAGLGKAGRDRGNWQDQRRIVHFAKERGEETWMETTWLACGHAASLPMQSTQVTTEKPTDPKEESSVSSSDEEERALGSEALSSAPYLSVPVNTDDYSPTRSDCALSARCSNLSLTFTRRTFIANK